MRSTLSRQQQSSSPQPVPQTPAPGTFQFRDRRPETAAHQHLKTVMERGAQQQALPVQRMQNGAASGQVIQMWPPSWWPFGKKKEADPYENLSHHDRLAVNILDNINHQEHARDRVRNRGLNPDDRFYGYQQQLDQHDEDIHSAKETALHESALNLTDKAASTASFIGSSTVALGNLLHDNPMGHVGRITQGLGEGVGTLGSGLQAIMGIHNIATSEDKLKDKATKGVDVAGSLASMVQSGASGLGTASSLFPKASGLSSVASTASHAIAPASIAIGGANLVSGAITGGLAHYRSNQLANMHMDSHSQNQGLANYASHAQWAKAKSNYGKALGGALGVAGGAAMLALGLSNPVGWGLMAGASLVGLGVGAYKMYQKHKLGKKIIEDEGMRNQLQEAGIEIPKNIGRKGFGDYFRTESMRRNNYVRAQIALKLAHQEGTSAFDEGPNDSARIVDHLGVARKKAREESPLLFGDDSHEKERAKTIAGALDF